MRLVAALAVSFVVGAASLFGITSPVAASVVLVPPVDGSIVRRFEVPAGSYGPGHRGIDYAVAGGATVRAAAGGTVSFAGMVAGDLFVTIDHGSGLETTYSELAEVYVETGAPIRARAQIGIAGRLHGGDPGLHFGVKVEGAYVDPELYLTDLDVTDAISLVPTGWEPPEQVRDIFRVDAARAARTEPCRDGHRLRVAPFAPNDNIVVTVPGINSSSAAAGIFKHGPEFLGYPPERIYRFSYKGSSGPRLHERFSARDTWGDLEGAARRLADLLREIKRRHPGRAVDLMAHSQGGIVARTFLELLADVSDGSLPVVGHLVTLSSPHRGAPLAGEAVEMRAGVGPERFVGEAASWATRRWSLPLPDPYSPAVTQLAPGSELMRTLESPLIPFGTRYLTLGIANDLIVPADRAHARGAEQRTLGPEGIAGAHSKIVTSTAARSLVYDFLRGAPLACEGFWDEWGPRAGWAISRLESQAVSVGAPFGLP